jgi:hypothetical protein
MIFFVVVILPVLILMIPAFYLLYDLHRESQGYSRMAKTMRRMRDEDPEGFRTIIRPFKDTFK